MSFADNPYRSYGVSAANAEVDARVDFIRKTYIHLTGAVLGFVFICAALLQVPAVQQICASFIQTPFMYLIAMFGLLGVSWICNNWAAGSTNISTQYAGLVLYTVAEAIFFLPMLWLAQHRFPGSITSAGAITMAVFIGLTLSVFITRADFSYLRTGLCIASFALIGLVICMMFFPMGNGGLLSMVLGGAFVVLAAGYILYHTSMVLHHYPVGMHVAAALALFASLATLFWYILQFMMQMSRRN